MKTALHILPTGWKGSNGMEQLAVTVDHICRMINGIDVVDGGSVFVSKDQILFRINRASSTAKFPWRVVSTDGAVVTIAGGYVLHGNYDPVAVAEKEVTITGGTDASPHYVVLEYNYDTQTGTIYGSSFASLPTSEPPNIFRCALHAFKRNGESAVRIMQRQFSDIIVPGWA